MGSPLFEDVAMFVRWMDWSGAGFAIADLPDLPSSLFWLVGLLAGIVVFCELAGLRYIANSKVGVVEKLWSIKGSVPQGRIIALNGEAGFQAEVLRGGLHFGLWRWQYRIHKVPLVTVPQGKIGYVYARDGDPLTPSQTLGCVVPSNNFQDARSFLVGEQLGPDQERIVGQRGRQRAILREGVYALNLALFYVLTEDTVYRLDTGGQKEFKTLLNWQNELAELDGFSPVIIGGPIETFDPLNPERKIQVDGMGIVTVHDGPSLPPGEIIAPAVAPTATTSSSTTIIRTPRHSSRAAAAGAFSTCL